jgi:hypothetical protein
MRFSYRNAINHTLTTCAILVMASAAFAQKKIAPPPPLQGVETRSQSAKDATLLEDLSPLKTTFHLKWRYKKFPANIRLFEVSNSTVPRLNVTLNDNNWEKNLPIVREITDGKVTLEGASFKMLAMVVENTSDKPLYFYAAPHSIEPAQGSLGVKFYCLCFGDIFRIRPKTTWYRLVQVRVFPSNRTPEITMVHEILGIDEAKAKAIENND